VIVIPLAGSSTRFRSAGIHSPKWSLEVDGMTVLNKSINSIVNSLNEFETLLLIIDSSHEYILSPLIEEYRDLNLNVYKLDSPTLGQADTVRQGLHNHQDTPSERLIIWCGDSAFNGDSLNFREELGNWVGVSKLKGDHWSFVELKNNLVCRVAEKKRISELASIGLYGFNSVFEFLQLDFSGVLEENTEIYVAPLYNQLILVGAEVRILEIEKSDYYPFGTPEEFLETCHRFGWGQP
jgi:NDP-sugar pyrophosphorylase family protein